jgi:hypothetical protein
MIVQLTYNTVTYKGNGGNLHMQATEALGQQAD